MKYTLKSSAPRQEVVDLERELNPQQRAVVAAPTGRILVLAGAGTGKTRTLTYRVARLVASGCPPERILLLTFTNRAAREMVDRVESILGKQLRRCAAGTFHHLANRILRKRAEVLGFSPDYTIVDPEDARDLLQMSVAEEGLPALTTQRFPQPKVIDTIRSLAVSTRQSVRQVIDSRYPKFNVQSEAIERVLVRYTAHKRRYNLCDFDDLLSFWFQLLHDPGLASVGDELRDEYSHVLVDEYQDITAIEGAIVDAMARDHGSLTCVGDDAQSIYSFRGADFAQIHEFDKRHRDAVIYPLTINYRSVPQVLELANRSIAHNKNQHRKELTAVRQNGLMPALIALRDVFQQSEFVAQRILELHHERSLRLAQMAVLYRNHAHSLELQIELSRRQIPYSIRSGARFFEQAHIKDVIAYLRARENPRDSLAWVRILRLWPGIGNQIAERIGSALALDDELRSPQSIANRLDALVQESKGRGRASIEGFAAFWHQLAAADESGPAASLALVIESHYKDYVDRNWSNAAARKEDLEHLLQYSKRYASIQEFLSDLALVSGLAAESVLGGGEEDDRLILSSIHQAKGLEWRAVFVIGLADGDFPSAPSISSPTALEEERRLFYVATTRAEDELYLCYPITQESKGDRSHFLRPSRFLQEIDHRPRVFERWEIDEAPPESAEESERQ
jgi:DNA helicase-2/ATP-dependent DNA helicase PcrA